MVWTVLPLALAAILVMGMLLAASASGNNSGPPAREELSLVETRESGLIEGERFAIVEEHALLRFLSREEFDSLKRLNPKLIEMRACHIVYLTELPQGKTPPLAVPKPVH
jgi:hypothetical protein